MATSLNPDAPSYISILHHTEPSPSPHLGHYIKPDPSISYNFAPLHIQQKPEPSSVVYLSPPPSFGYQFYCYPWYPISQLVISPSSCAQVSSPSVPRCSLQELDDNGNLVPKESSGVGEMVVAEPRTSVFVVNKRVRRPKVQRAVIQGTRWQEPRRKPSIKVEHRFYEINKEIDVRKEWRTTLMIKNIPNKFSKEKLISVIRDHLIEENRKVPSVGEEAVLSAIDYFYLPVDFRTRSNFGFAFVNFTTPIGASRMCKYLHDYSWLSYGSQKVCKVNWARIQGFVKSIENADRRSFELGTPDVFLPVHFEPPYNGLVESAEYIHGKRIISGV